MKDTRAVIRLLAVLLAFAIAQPAWVWAATKGPELPNPGTVPISKQEQEQLGLKATGEVYQQMPVLPDSSPVTQYVQRLGRQLAQVIPQQYSWPYQFHVVQQKEINAFALPGGPIFVNIGTITSADNEAQLAGVLAHEMSHVYMQHSIKGAIKQQTTQGIAGIIGGLLGSVIGGTAGALVNLGARVTGAGLSLKYSREDEAQADSVGAIILYKAGYNPVAMANFFQKLEKEGGAGGPQFLSDHPNPGNRVAAVENEIKPWPGKSFNASTGKFSQAKQQAQNVKAYTAEQIAQMAKSGQIHNTSVPAGVSTSGGQTAPMGSVNSSEVMPSGSLQQFNQNGVSFDYPSNWQVMSDQQNGGLTVAPQAGVSQGAIAYGVIINGFQPQGASSLSDATQELINGLKQSNPDLKAMGSPQTITVNGVQGKSVDLKSTSPIQQNGKAVQERDWLVTLPGSNGSVVYLVFVSPENDFSRLRPTYENMLRSFRMQQ